MGIRFEEVMELSRKAALLDGVVRYIKAKEFIDKEDILAFLGELKDDSEDGSEGGDSDV